MRTCAIIHPLHLELETAIYKMACRLVESGVETTLDQWDLQLGSNLMKFMEHGLTKSDRVLVVCTDNYNKKSNEGLGGVGYEKNVLTAELFIDQDTAKFIPCIRGVTTRLKTPVCWAEELTSTSQTMPTSTEVLTLCFMSYME
jgi:hypothetical protein